ncbi:MAG: hypothetical protein U0800_24870 [Isosphaeraceae bacterium]
MRLAKSYGGWMILAALAVGCSKAPETPPEQKSVASGEDAMEKMKSMAPMPTGKDAKPQSAMEKMKNMGK